MSIFARIKKTIKIFLRVIFNCVDWCGGSNAHVQAGTCRGHQIPQSLSLCSWEANPKLFSVSYFFRIFKFIHWRICIQFVATADNCVLKLSIVSTLLIPEEADELWELQDSLVYIICSRPSLENKANKQKQKQISILVRKGIGRLASPRYLELISAVSSVFEWGSYGIQGGLKLTM